MARKNGRKRGDAPEAEPAASPAPEETPEPAAAETGDPETESETGDEEEAEAPILDPIDPEELDFFVKLGERVAGGYYTAEEHAKLADLPEEYLAQLAPLVGQLVTAPVYRQIAGIPHTVRRARLDAEAAAKAEDPEAEGAGSG